MNVDASSRFDVLVLFVKSFTAKLISLFIASRMKFAISSISVLWCLKSTSAICGEFASFIITES